MPVICFFLVHPTFSSRSLDTRNLNAFCSSLFLQRIYCMRYNKNEIWRIWNCGEMRLLKSAEQTTKYNEWKIYSLAVFFLYFFCALWYSRTRLICFYCANNELCFVSPRWEISFRRRVFLSRPTHTFLKLSPTQLHAQTKTT